MAGLNPLLKVATANYCYNVSVRCLSNNYARICVTNRPLYQRTYPTLVILPDGSSFTCRFHQPRQLIKLPMDITLLSEKDKALWLSRRKPIKKVQIQDEVKNTFTSKQYIDLVKKKKS